MTGDPNSFWTKLKRPRVFLPTLLGLIVLGGTASYLILLNPNSIFVRWAQAALPSQVTMITIGPYPEAKDFELLKKEKIKYIVSTLDPRLPYEKVLIDREEALVDKYGMTLKIFPMASIFDQKVFSDYLENQKKAVDFLKNIDAPAYVHCYLGKHRTLRVREAAIKAGVPRRYFQAGGSSQEYWELVNRITAARTEFHKNNSTRVLEILNPITTKDVDVTYMRGWSHYRLGMIDDAMKDFQEGLALDPNNPRNLEGLGYCFLRSDQPVMAQRQFNAVLEQLPNEQGSLVGLGLSYLNLGNKSDAARTFRKVLQLNPENEEVKGYLKQAEAP